MGFQVTGTIKLRKLTYVNPYINVDFHGVKGKMHIEGMIWETLSDYTAGQPPLATEPYFDVALTNFAALSGNAAGQVQTRADNYVKAQILAAFPTVTFS